MRLGMKLQFISQQRCKVNRCRRAGKALESEDTIYNEELMRMLRRIIRRTTYEEIGEEVDLALRRIQHRLDAVTQTPHNRRLP
jgi:hypothetical protein